MRKLCNPISNGNAVVLAPRCDGIKQYIALIIVAKTIPTVENNNGDL
jgi:hypothetical protein